VGLTWGETSNNISAPGSLKQNLPDSRTLIRVIDNSSTWGLRAGHQNELSAYYATYENQSGKFGPFKLRQQIFWVAIRLHPGRRAD